MKSTVEIISHIPKPVLEFLSFAGLVFSGAIFKMRRLHEKGIKITFRRFLIEAFMSFFIAMIAYAFIDQFLHFNKLFTYAFCSLAGSMSELFYTKMEELFTTSFDTIKKKLTKQ